MKTSKIRMDLETVFKNFQIESFRAPWIIYDKKVIPKYRIIRESLHDGTYCFSQNLLFNTMKPLFEHTSYFKSEEPPEGSFPIYTVGDAKIATVFGFFDINGHSMQGQRERVTLPVSVKYLPFKDALKLFEQITKARDYEKLVGFTVLPKVKLEDTNEGPFEVTWSVK